MKTIKQISFYALLLFVVTGCIDDFTLNGNGIESTQKRPVSGFERVKSSGDFEVHIAKGNEFEVVINAEENVIQHIETSVSGNALLIDIPGFHIVRNRLPMTVNVTLPTLTGITQSGSGNITTDLFTSDKVDFSISGSGSISAIINANIVDATISGSGMIKITGEANQSNLGISGSGNIDSYNLLVNSCNANISGSGNMHIKAAKSIIAKISGSGNIYYIGNPGVDINISGSGKVIRSN